MFKKISGLINCVLLLMFIINVSLTGEEITTSKNLLKNTSFQLCTNPGFPDFWAGQDGWREGVYHEVVAESYISETKSVKLSNLDGRSTTFFTNNFGWSPDKPGAMYTLSVYLKSEPSGLVAQIGSERTELKEVEVDSTWKRYFVTAPLKAEQGYGANYLTNKITLTAKKGGHLYINAPMLVRGEELNGYQSSDLEKKQKKDKTLSPSKESCLGEWIFEETVEKDADGKIVIKDRSGKGNNGKIVGNCAWVNTKFGSALSFDGKTYVLIPYHPSLDTKKDEFSIEILLKPNPGKDTPILIKGMHFGGYSLDISSGSYRPIVSPWKSAPGPKVIPIDSHIMVTFEKPEIKFYLNGELTNKGELDVNLDPESSKRPLIIGGFDIWSQEKGYHPEPGFEGWIKMVKIYNRALTEDEVKSQYQKLFER